MCGRYSLTTPPEVLAALFRLAQVPAWAPRYNIAPTQQVPVVRAAGAGADAGSGRRFDVLHWGLIPAWAEEPRVGGQMINARAESAATKPVFREAFRRRRCLVPADGFYEWKKLASGKQPYCIRRRDHEPFAFAGLWERWRGSDAYPPIESFTILTTEPNTLLRQLHDRMPVILVPDDFDLWLDPSVQDPERLGALLSPSPEERLVAYPVSTRVNRPANDEPSCLEEVAEPAEQQELF